MEKINARLQTGMVHRAVALGLAVVTTAFIATGTVAIITGSTDAAGATLVRAAFAPLKAMLGN